MNAFNRAAAVSRDAKRGELFAHAIQISRIGITCRRCGELAPGGVLPHRRRPTTSTSCDECRPTPLRRRRQSERAHRNATTDRTAIVCAVGDAGADLEQHFSLPALCVDRLDANDDATRQPHQAILNRRNTSWPSLLSGKYAVRWRRLRKANDKRRDVSTDVPCSQTRVNVNRNKSKINNNADRVVRAGRRMSI